MLTGGLKANPSYPTAPVDCRSLSRSYGSSKLQSQRQRDRGVACGGEKIATSVSRVNKPMYYTRYFRVPSPNRHQQPLGHGVSLAAGPAFSKWGEAARAGFQILPDVLFKNQHALGLSAVDLIVLANLTLHWWYPDQKPFPRSATIARRMGVDVRTVQRSLTRLAKLGLAVREKASGDGRSDRFDLSGLVAKLGDLAVSDASYLYRSNRLGSLGAAASEDIL